MPTQSSPVSLWNAEAVGQAIEKRNYIEALPQWLDQFKWRLFGTLKFTCQPPSDVAEGLVREFISQLRGGQFYAAVGYQTSPFLHAHLVVGGWRGSFDPFHSQMMERLWSRRWPHGETWVTRFHPHRGGVAYSLRESGVRPDSWDLIGCLKRVRTRRR